MKKIVENLFNLTCRKCVINQQQPLTCMEGTLKKQVRRFCSGTNTSDSQVHLIKMQCQGISLLFGYLFWIARWWILNKHKRIWLRNPNYKWMMCCLWIGNLTRKHRREVPAHVQLFVILVLSCHPPSLVELSASNPFMHTVLPHECTDLFLKKRFLEEQLPHPREPVRSKSTWALVCYIILGAGTCLRLLHF